MTNEMLVKNTIAEMAARSLTFPLQIFPEFSICYRARLSVPETVETIWLNHKDGWIVYVCGTRNTRPEDYIDCRNTSDAIFSLKYYKMCDFFYFLCSNIQARVPL